jgi:hypothetical protein
LHLERDESFKDLFDHAQPRSRLEDLVRIYGLREGVVSIDGFGATSTFSCVTPSPTSPVFRSSPSQTARSKQPVRSLKPAAIPFSSFSVSFSPRQVGLQIMTAGKSKRTVVQTERTRDERLEAAAKRLVMQLAEWLDGS